MNSVRFSFLALSVAVTTALIGGCMSVQLYDGPKRERDEVARISGDPVISIDNLEQPLGGELLCTCLTQPIMKIRILGQSLNVEVPSIAAMFATGNNLTVIGSFVAYALLVDTDQTLAYRTRPDFNLSLRCERVNAKAGCVPFLPVSVDFSLGMLQADRSGAPRVQADILRLPVPDASVDGVTCGFALRNLVDLGAFFDELGRAVRPGGRIALFTTARHRSARTVCQ